MKTYVVCGDIGAYCDCKVAIGEEIRLPTAIAEKWVALGLVKDPNAAPIPEQLIQSKAIDSDCQYIDSGMYVDKPGDPNDCLPVWLCLVANVPDGKCYVISGDTKLFEEVTLMQGELRAPAGQDGSKVFESEVHDFIQVQATNAVTSIGDAIKLAVEAGLPDLVCKETGQSTAATANDICGFKVSSLVCGSTYLSDPADIKSTSEVGSDDAYFVGGVNVNSAHDNFGVVDIARPVAAGADAVAVWSFQLQRTLSKAEIAAL